jgi:hypothetical protein
VNDFQLVLRTVSTIFFTCAVLAVVVAGLEAFIQLPHGEYLVKKFGDILMLCVGAIAGLLAGRQLERRERRRVQQPAE